LLPLAQALLKRLAIQRNLTDWVRHCGYQPAAHHRLLIDRLEEVAAGRIKRLAIFMPPGSAKSTYTSRLFPPWYLANHKAHNILAASHTLTLAERFGRHCRNLIDEHKNVLDLELAADSAAAGRWALVSGGEYMAAGAGGAIAGYRADGVLIDDPIRGREDADSELIREKLWDWYRSDVTTRLRPGGWVVLIQTRWHEDDLAGRLLAEMEAGREHWTVISLPAEAEAGDPLGRQPGELLWDDDPGYAYGDLLRHEKAVQTPRNWSALYQQRPTPDTGDYFQESWLIAYDKPPDRTSLNVYGGSDYAVTSNGGDYTVHVVVGIDPKGELWLLDLWRKQAASDQWIESLGDLIRKWKPIGWAEEKIQITSGIGPHLERRLRERSAWIAREQFPTRGDKAARAQSIRGRMALKGLHVPFGVPWYPDFRSELLHFPAGRHDDIVDALGLVGQLLDKMADGRVPKGPGGYNYESLKDSAYKSPNDGYSDFVQSSVKLL
jgi:predicted phage terminase large subunit-like protein